MGRMTVKQYAEKNNISVQTVYTKMKRKEEKLKGHIYYIKGVRYLDDEAQKLLMPVGGNYQLIKKSADNEKELASCKEKSERLSKKSDEQTEEIKNLKTELSEKNAEIENLRNTVAVLTEKCTNFDNITKRLCKIFDFFEDSKNTGILKKVGNYINKG